MLDDRLKHGVREDFRYIGEEVYARGTRRLTQRWKKMCVGNEGEFVGKNTAYFAKDVPTIYVNFIALLVLISKQ